MSNERTPSRRVQDLYDRLHRSAGGQVWHESDIKGHHLYTADTSFGYGPIFRMDRHAWGCETGLWEPLTVGTVDDDLALALELSEEADWQYRLAKLDSP